jgi:hypothetical protein
MARVADLLVSDRIIDRRQRDQILQAQALYGGSFDTNLLEAGILDEKTLQGYLERAHGQPNRVDVWGDPDPQAASLLTRAQAERYRVVPFKLNMRVLDVILNDPTDVRALDEVAFITGCRLSVNVATEMRVAVALFTGYQIGLPHRMQQLLMRGPVKPPATMPGPAGGAPASWQEPLPPDDSGPGEMPGIRIPEMADAPPVVTPPSRPGRPTPLPMRAATPPIEIALPPPKITPTSVVAVDASHVAIGPPDATYHGPPPFANNDRSPVTMEDTPPMGLELEKIRTPTQPPPPARTPTQPPPESQVQRSYAGLAEQLELVDDRDEIPSIVLPYLAATIARVVLFIVRRNLLAGWDARGKRLRRESVETLVFPLDRRSIFADVIAKGAPFTGALPHDDVEESLVIKLADEEWPEHALIVPIRVQGRPVALLYGEATSSQTLAAAREPAVVIADMLSETFLRLIRAKKGV